MSKIQDIIDDFKTIRDRRKPLEEKWVQYYKNLYMYRGDLTPQEETEIALGVKSDIRIAREMSLIQTKHPRVVNTIFANDPIVRAIPVTEKSIKTAKNKELAVNYFMKTKLYIPFFMADFQCLYTGTGSVGLDWDMIEYGDEFVEGPSFNFLDIFNTYVPDQCLTHDDMEVCYRRFIKTRTYIEKMIKKGVYKKDCLTKLDDAKNSKENVSNKYFTDSFYSDRLNVLGLASGTKEDIVSASGEKKNNVFEIIEKWEKDRVQTIGNSTVSMRVEEEHMFKGFIPMYFLKDYPTDVMFYGTGENQLLGDLISYTNEIKNLRLTVIRKVAYPAALVSKNAFINPNDLVSRPNQVVMTDDMDGYREIQKADIKRILVDEEYIGKQDQEDITGLYSTLKGGSSPRAETATTSLNMREASMERINTMIFYNCEHFFKPLCRDLGWLIENKLDNKLFLDFTENDESKYVTFDKEDFKGLHRWEVTAFAIKSISDINLQQNFMQMYDRLIKSTNLNPYYLDKKMLEVFDVKNITELMLKGDEAQMLDAIRQDPEIIKKFVVFMQILQQQQAQEKIKQEQSQEQPGGFQVQPGSANMQGGTEIPGVNMAPEVAPTSEELGGQG